MGRPSHRICCVALGGWVALAGCARQPAPGRRAPVTADAAAPRRPAALPPAPRRLPPRRPPRPRRPAVVLPRGLANLTVARYRPAVYVAPRYAGPAPWPVVVILHGNFDRPEWECEWWLPARRLGWLLCPRGRRRPGVPLRLDRWTYAGPGYVVREVHAALDTLAGRYQGLIRERDATLIGFSLGGIFGPGVMLGSRLRFTGAIFVEGGAGVSASEIRQLARRGLGRVAYLCGQHSGCGAKARKVLRAWRRYKVDARLWIMPGVGHGYNEDFEPLAAQVLTWLRGGVPGGPPRPKP